VDRSPEVGGTIELLCGACLVSTQSEEREDVKRKGRGGISNRPYLRLRRERGKEGRGGKTFSPLGLEKGKGGSVGENFRKAY